MIGLLLWPALGLVCLCLALSYPLAVRPALQHRRHDRTLANIARLERELGYDVTIDTEYVGNYAHPVVRSTPWLAEATQHVPNYMTGMQLSAWKHHAQTKQRSYRRLSRDYVDDYLEQMRKPK